MMSLSIKKAMGALAALVLAGALAACASGGGAAETPAEETSKETSLSMSNPWSDAASADDAATGAFEDTFVVPEDFPLGDIDWQAPTFRYMDGIAEANYEGGAVRACVRKGKGVSGVELHGVYEESWVEWTFVADGVDVECLGHEEGIANILEWSSKDYNYSIYVDGLGGENYGVSEGDIATLVGAIS